MKSLISAIALMFAITAPGYAAETVKTNPDPDKPARAVEDGTVKTTETDTDKMGRKVEEKTVKVKKPTHAKHGRAIQKSKKRKAPVEEKQGREQEQAKTPGADPGKK